MNEKIKQLVKLAEENPELEIFTMVDYEVCADDTFLYWKGEIKKVEKDIYWTYLEENIIIGADEIQERLEFNYDDSGDKESEEAPIQKEYERLLESGEIKEAIIIYIGV